MGTCGMNVCRKCGVVNLIFGILLLITALWGGAPSWFSPWTVVGVYLLLWGFGSGVIGKEH